MSAEFLSLDPTHVQLLHELVDALSAALAVPVHLTDSHLRSLARRSTTPVVDDRPEPPIGLMDVVRAAPAHELTEIVELPAVPQLGIHREYAVPVRSGNRTLAILWLVDERGRLTPAHLDYAASATEAVIATLEAVLASRSTDPADDRGALMSHPRSGAARAVIESACREGRFTHDDQFLAVSVAIEPSNSHPETLFATQQLLRGLANRLRAVLPGRRAIDSTRGPELVAVFAPRVLEDTQALKERITTVVTDHLYRSGHEWAVSKWSLGFSGRAQTLDRAAEAVKQARTASAVAQRSSSGGSVLEWTAIRHLRGISSLDDIELVENFLDPALEAFLSDPALSDLAETLRGYLEHAGHVPEVASSMYLHRATVYYRLRRIEEVLGVDLASGADRLQLHLGIAAWDFLRGNIVMEMKAS